MSRRALIATVACLIALVPACGDGNEERDDLRAALRATERSATAYVYEEQTEEAEVEVKGLIEDDFRYSAQVSRDGRPVLEQIVSDDALAVRILDPRVLRFMIEDPEAASAETALEGVSVAEALSSRRWVLDPIGAPPTTTSAEDLDRTGSDPVLDARIVFAYVERAMGTAFDIVLYNPDSLSYKASEDPFPAPEDGSSVRRYDLLAPFVPGPDPTGQPGAGLPGLVNLRKMSVYVEDGKVIRVAERVAAEGDQGDRLEFFLEETLERIDPSQGEQFARAIETLDEEDRSDFLIATLNAILQLSGEDPIRPRDMVVDFVDGGGDEVDLPSEAIEASLALFHSTASEDGDTGSGVATDTNAGASAGPGADGTGADGTGATSPSGDADETSTDGSAPATSSTTAAP